MAVTAKATKEKTERKPSRPRKQWADVQKDNPLYLFIQPLIEQTDKRLVFIPSKIEQICSIAKQESFPFSSLPWEEILTVDKKLTKHQRLMKDLAIADWEEKQKRDWKKHSVQLQLDLDQVTDEMTKAKAELLEAYGVIDSLNLRLSEAKRLDEYNQLAKADMAEKIEQLQTPDDLIQAVLNTVVP